MKRHELRWKLELSLLQVMARAGFDPVFVPISDPHWIINTSVANAEYLDQGKIDVAFETSEKPG